PPPPCPHLFPYTPLFRSGGPRGCARTILRRRPSGFLARRGGVPVPAAVPAGLALAHGLGRPPGRTGGPARSRCRPERLQELELQDRKSTRLNSSHVAISY